MNRFGSVCAAGAVMVAMTAGGLLLSAQTTAIPEPRRGSGASVTPAFEGWYYNPDGSRSFLIGYYNRNAQQELDIPIGPNNRIEPGGPDMGQPTHFLPGRQWGMFALPAPKEFKPTDSYVWTIVANGQSISVPFRLTPDYVRSLKSPSATRHRRFASSRTAPHCKDRPRAWRPPSRVPRRCPRRWRSACGRPTT